MVEGISKIVAVEGTLKRCTITMHYIYALQDSPWTVLQRLEERFTGPFHQP